MSWRVNSTHLTASIAAISMKKIRIRPGSQYEVENENLPYIRKIGNILRNEDSPCSEGF